MMPLEIAMTRNNTDNVNMVRCLLNLGAAPTGRPVYAGTLGPFYTVVDAAVFLAQELGAGVSFEVESDDYGELGPDIIVTSPLIAAAYNGCMDMVLRLIDLGSDVNDYDDERRTPLIVAASNGNLKLVRCLVEIGGDVNKVDKRGSTALCGQLDVVRFLVELGVSIEVTNGNGNTALLESAIGREYLTMHFLLEDAGANFECVNDGGFTVWDHVLEIQEEDVSENEAAALTAVLRVMVLRSAPPPTEPLPRRWETVATRMPENARVMQEGARLRARLPAYLVQQRALMLAFFNTHCPVLLPPLWDVVQGYAELSTTEELWATGLGAAP
jgi:hypothetical protein